MTASNSAGSAGVQLAILVSDIAPAGITYSTNPAVYTKGQAIPINTPSTTGGNVFNWSVTPLPPAGLSFSTATGVLSGTPTALTPATPYNVIATNAVGSASATLTVTIVDVPPSHLTYSQNPAIYSTSVPIVANVPSSNGGAVVSYAITPALPPGLSLNTTTGVISGTPTALSAATQYTVTATNTGGSTSATLTITIMNLPPAQLRYSANPAIYTKDQVIPNNVPASSGGPVISYAITPAPPSGLMFDTTTGILAGTPLVLSPATSYSVTATSLGGSETITLTITVNDVPPSRLSYSQNPATYARGQPVPANVPTISGGPVTSWSILPTLPLGLTFDTATGVITGTPAALSSLASYTISAANSGGATTAMLFITVNDVPPADLTYETNPAIYTLGEPITNDAPSNTGGTATLYAISPALPPGLELDMTTGIISGAPAVLSPEVSYTVTATNTGGSATATLSITVNDVPPSGLVYSTNPAVYAAGIPITANVPSVSGGAVTSWAIAPAPPTGLAFSTSTGILSGTPTIIAPSQNYQITATNSGGLTTTTLSIAVNVAPPAGLTYSANPAVYMVGQPIANNTPSSTGGAIASYAISPALPAGLGFNTTTGVVSGTPTAVTAASSYTVTATNASGSTTTTLTITIGAAAAPKNLSYSANPAVFTKGSVITNDTPTVTGTVSSWSIAPALPAGLTFSATTGIVSGAPTVLSAATSYTVTASNSAGSTTATVTLTVKDVPPSGIAYSSNPAVFVINQPITNDTPANLGGTVVSWAISPALPTGLSFSTTTGIVSGTPTVTSSATGHTVTATNTGGSATVTLTITVNNVPPTGLSYSLNPAVYSVGTAITSNVPTVGGGPVTSWSIVPALPAGLSFNATTGVISGTPTTPTTLATYTVTASNSAGSTQAVLTITVNQAAPSGLRYSASPATWYVSRPITNDTPSNGGGSVTAYAISPALPAGLSFNTTTGVISGTPTVVTPSAGYVVTASNSVGATTVTVTIKVAGYAASSVAAGGYHTCAVVNGSAQCWGDNADGDLGNNSTSRSSIPVLVSGLTTGVTAVSAGGDESCAIVSGDVYCWGSNSNGQLGIDPTSQSSSSVPVQVSGLAGVNALSVGQAHVCALVSGSVRCWGVNELGQLGNGATTDSPVPVQVEGLTSGVTAVSGVTDHTCAVVNGGVQCWGWNQYGQLGNGSTTNSSVPVQVSGLTSGVTAVATAWDFTCALANGGVSCWGMNAQGELGEGSTSSGSSVPVQVSGLTSGVNGLTAGFHQACALSGGQVWCWGDNTYGDLGNNSTANSASPVQVLGIGGTGYLNAVQTISGGDGDTCAYANGYVYCWGYDQAGELGNGTTVNSSVPRQVGGWGP